MQRTKVKETVIKISETEKTNNTGEKQCFFLNTGGTFRDKRGRIRKVNERFLAYPSEIPMAFRDTIIMEEQKDDVNEVQEELIVHPKYSIRSSAPGWYNVYDENEKQMNEKALRQVEAQELVNNLIGN